MIAATKRTVATQPQKLRRFVFISGSVTVLRLRSFTVIWMHKFLPQSSWQRTGPKCDKNHAKSCYASQRPVSNGQMVASTHRSSRRYHMKNSLKAMMLSAAVTGLLSGSTTPLNASVSHNGTQVGQLAFGSASF